MAETLGRRRAESFRIHEDVPSTEDTEMNEDTHPDDEEAQDGGQDDGHESDVSESSDDGGTVDVNVQLDMEKLQDNYPGFRQKYRLIKRIGEGMLSVTARESQCHTAQTDRH